MAQELLREPPIEGGGCLAPAAVLRPGAAQSEPKDTILLNLRAHLGGLHEPWQELAPGNALIGLSALRGKLVELSSGASQGCLSVAMQLILETQTEGENCAWVSAGGGLFHPPDAALWGVDLAALPVISAPSLPAAGRVTSHLLRSEAFGLVVLDLSGLLPRLPQPLLSRLVGLAQKAQTALVILTDKPSGAESLGAIIGLHVVVRRQPLPAPPDAAPRYRLTLEAAKDKRRGPGWREVRTLALSAEME